MNTRDEWQIRVDEGEAENAVAVVRYARDAEKAVRVFQIVPKIEAADEAWAATIAREAEAAISHRLEPRFQGL